MGEQKLKREQEEAAARFINMTQNSKELPDEGAEMDKARRKVRDINLKR